MDFSGYSSIVSQGDSANIRWALDTKMGVSPVVGEAGLLGKVEGAVPKVGRKRWRREERERSPLVAEERSGMAIGEREGIQESRHFWQVIQAN